MYSNGIHYTASVEFFLSVYVLGGHRGAQAKEVAADRRKWFLARQSEAIVHLTFDSYQLKV